jgi:hypothetical protein
MMLLPIAGNLLPIGCPYPRRVRNIGAGGMMAKHRIKSKRRCARCKKASGKQYLYLHQTQYVCGDCFEIIDVKHQRDRARQKLNFVRNSMFSLILEGDP